MTRSPAYLIVSDKWLEACGKQRLSGVMLKIDWVPVKYQTGMGRFFEVIIPCERPYIWTVAECRCSIVIDKQEEFI